MDAAALLFALGLILFPILRMALAAFKRPVDLTGLTLLFALTPDNFRAMSSQPWNIGRTMLNSPVVAAATAVVAIPASTRAAYAFSRFEMRFTPALFFLVVATRFVPAVVLPFHLLFRDLGPLDTVPAS